MSEVEGELNISGVYMPRFFAEPKTLSSKKDRERQDMRYVPPAPRPHHLRSAPSQTRTRLIHSRLKSDSQADFDSSFHQLMQSEKLINGTSTASIFRDVFEIQSRLGFGSFGDVYRCKDKSTGIEYAVKKSRVTFTGDGDRSRKLLEVQRICQIPPHNHLVALENAWEEEGHLFLQMELCAKSLHQYIEEGNQLDEGTAWDVLIDMLQALHHLHKHHLVHMDVKTDNILLSKEAPTLYKLGDFGITISLDETRDIGDYTEGDCRYLAPEVIQGGHFSTKADVFSLGMTILEMSCHVDLPRTGELWQDLRRGILPPPCDITLPKSLREVIGLMLEPNVNLRPEVATLLAMPAVRRKAQRRKWTSLIIMGRRRRGTVRHRSTTPESVMLVPPEVHVNDNSFSDDDDLIPTKTSTPVFASTPISASKSKNKSSARFKTGRFSRLAQTTVDNTPASRNLLREFDAVSESE